MRIEAFTGTALLAVALAASGAACTGSSDAGEAATPTQRAPSATVEETPAPLPPASFAAEATPFKIVLTWDPPPDEVERFELFRDGYSLGTQLGSLTSYTDQDVRPGQVYNYEIASRSGELVSGRLHQSVETPVPPLRAARLAGSFDVRTRFLSKSGYGEYAAPTFGWRFRPKCGSGPCDVVLRDLHEARTRATLQRRGTRYRSSFTGRIGLECSGSPVTSSVTVALRVDDARVVGSEWLATRLVGTVSHSEGAQLGCRASSARLAVRARLVR
jgi:hypothetical protein